MGAKKPVGQLYDSPTALTRGDPIRRNDGTE